MCFPPSSVRGNMLNLLEMWYNFNFPQKEFPALRLSLSFIKGSLCLPNILPRHLAEQGESWPEIHKECPGTFKLLHASKSAGVLFQHRLLGPTLRVSNSVSSRWGLRVLIANKHQVMLVPLVHKPHFENHPGLRQRKRKCLFCNTCPIFWPWKCHLLSSSLTLLLAWQSSSKPRLCLCFTILIWYLATWKRLKM